jgi:hypothetical protein
LLGMYGLLFRHAQDMLTLPHLPICPLPHEADWCIE